MCVNTFSKTFLILLHKQKCMQKHDNELNLLKSFDSFVYKFIELIQLLNPNKGEHMSRIQFTTVMQGTYLKEVIDS